MLSEPIHPILINGVGTESSLEFQTLKSSTGFVSDIGWDYSIHQLRLALRSWYADREQAVESGSSLKTVS